ncbi:MAG: helix-turn-helix transcriptional regulator, partial [Lachnospiraceae bacterium]|nr:helix-turn-helix transcriptional regulator [Lachnospiraceae bacterium]
PNKGELIAAEGAGDEVERYVNLEAVCLKVLTADASEFTDPVVFADVSAFTGVPVFAGAATSTDAASALADTETPQMTGMLFSDGLPYLYIAFPEASSEGAPVAYFIIGLDMETVRRECLVSSVAGDRVNVCVYSGDEPVIIPVGPEDNKDFSYYDQVLLRPYESDITYPVYILEGQDGVFVTGWYSASLDLLFLSFLRPVGHSVFQLLQICLVPLLVSFATLSAAYLYFTRKWYKPIRTLMVKTASRHDATLMDESSDELDYLVRSYWKNDKHLREMDYIISADRHAMLNQLVSLLLKSSGEDTGRVAALLMRCYPEIDEARSSAVLVLRLIYAEYEMPDETECAVQRAVLRERAEQFWGEETDIMVAAVVENSQYQVAVLLFARLSEEDLVRKLEGFSEKMMHLDCGIRAITGWRLVEHDGEGRVGTKDTANRSFDTASAELTGNMVEKVPQAFILASEEASRRSYSAKGRSLSDKQAEEAAVGYAEEFSGLCERILDQDASAEDELRALPGKMLAGGRLDAAAVEDILRAAGAEVLISRGISKEGFGDMDMDSLIAQMKRVGSARQFRYVEDAKTYIQEHYYDSMLSLDTVSDMLGISKYYLSSLFTQLAETGFSDYVRKVRVDKAKDFLEHTDNTAAEVGFKAGFASTQSFYSVFKKYTGETPRSYRQRVKGKTKAS